MLHHQPELPVCTMRIQRVGVGTMFAFTRLVVGVPEATALPQLLPS